MLGCWIDNHAGQYAGGMLAELADSLLGTDFVSEWPKDDDGSLLGTYGRTGSPWAGLQGDDDIEVMVSIMDRAEAALNASLEEDDRAWGWYDGDFGLYPLEDEDY